MVRAYYEQSEKAEKATKEKYSHSDYPLRFVDTLGLASFILVHHSNSPSKSKF
jgi:hypothetical protein